MDAPPPRPMAEAVVGGPGNRVPWAGGGRGPSSHHKGLAQPGGPRLSDGADALDGAECRELGAWGAASPGEVAVHHLGSVRTQARISSGSGGCNSRLRPLQGRCPGEGMRALRGLFWRGRHHGGSDP